jgi:hypothetical protein
MEEGTPMYNAMNSDQGSRNVPTMASDTTSTSSNVPQVTESVADHRERVIDAQTELFQGIQEVDEVHRMSQIPGDPHNDTEMRREGFKAGNNVPGEANLRKKQRLETEPSSEHPAQTPIYKELLSKGSRRIQTKDMQRFIRALELYLLRVKCEDCSDMKSKKKTKCYCLKTLLATDDGIHDAVQGVSAYYNLTHETRKAALFARVKSAVDQMKNPHKAWKKRDSKQQKLDNKVKEIVYLKGKLFSLYLSTSFVSFFLCRHAFQKLFGIGHSVVDTLKRFYVREATDMPLAHGLVNQTNRTLGVKEAMDSLDVFFKNLRTEGDPYASRLVRTAAGESHMRDDEDDVLLPNYWTKRKIYERWVYGNGIIAKSNGGDSTYGSIGAYIKRPFDDDWPEGSLTIQVVSFASFLNYWKTKHSDIRIGQLARDTCADCWAFKEKLRRLDAARRSIDEIIDDGTCVNGNGSINESIINDNNSVSNTSIPIHYNTNDLNNLNDSHLDIMSGLAQHVNKFEAQRNYVKEKAKKATLDRESDVAFTERSYCYCGDYSQNLDLPHFGSEQPGDTFYFSPLTMLVFGLVDHSTKILSAYVYSEGEGKKGGNNVSSLLNKKLKDEGIFEKAKAEGPGKELCFVFDNCAGQNKNRMVVRFCQYLVDIGVFRRIEIVFLVAGHTKNICDRRFKDLKNNFHPRNVYTTKQLISVLKEGKHGQGNNKYLEVHEVTSKDFFIGMRS